MINDARYIDIVKAINRTMEEKSLEDKYLGCNVWMKNSVQQDKPDADSKKDLSIDLGFDKDITSSKAVIEDTVKNALLKIYESVESIQSTIKELKSKQYELHVDATANESSKSEEKLAKQNEEEKKKQEEERKAKYLAEEEARKKAAEQAKIEHESEYLVDRFAEKLTKSTSQDELDDIFDKIEMLKDENKISDAQFKRLFDIYNETEKALPSESEHKSLMSKTKYENRIKHAISTLELDQIKDAMYDDYKAGNLTKQAYQELLQLHGKYLEKKFKYGSTDSKVLDITPKKGESKSDFISRFMSETENEYPDKKQRLAVAYSYWGRANDEKTVYVIVNVLQSMFVTKKGNIAKNIELAEKFDSKEEAEAKAKEMAEKYRKPYIIEEIDIN